MRGYLQGLRWLLKDSVTRGVDDDREGETLAKTKHNSWSRDGSLRTESGGLRPIVIIKKGRDGVY